MNSERDREAVETREDLQKMILRVLAESPDGLPPAKVYKMLDERCDFPELWKRPMPKGDAREIFGQVPWQSVKKEELVARVRTEPQWQNEARWARANLVKEGLIDSATRGIWKLTIEGRRAVTRLVDRRGVGDRAMLPVGTGRSETLRASGGLEVEVSAQLEEADEAEWTGLVEDLGILIEDLSVADLRLVVELARVVRRRSQA